MMRQTLTAGAQRAIDRARQLAVDWGQSEVLPTHLLFALTAEESQAFEILGMQSLLLSPRDWERSMGFWRDALGLQVAADWSDEGHGAAALEFGDKHVIVAGPEGERDAEAGFPIEPGKLYIAAAGNGHSAKWSASLGELAASLVLNDEWVDPLPGDLFRVQWAGEVTSWAGKELLSTRRR